jgi:hypothetical protein
MPHNIPKIEYGGFVPTVISFDYPPTDDDGEELDVKERATGSISGVRQVSVDFVEATRKLKFRFLSEARLAELKSWFLGHAYLGKSFKYFDDKLGIDFVTYELKDFKFSPKKIAAVTANQYIYELALSFRRVVGQEGIDCMIATIANSQAVAANIVGLLLNSSEYKTVRVFFELRRKTSLEERIMNGDLTFIYRESTSAWELAGEMGAGDVLGVTFSVTAGGQVQYVSDTVPGTSYVGTIEFKNLTIC